MRKTVTQTQLGFGWFGRQLLFGSQQHIGFMDVSYVRSPRNLRFHRFWSIKKISYDICIQNFPVIIPETCPQNGFVWKWLVVPHCTQWLKADHYPYNKWLAIIGNINPTFSGPNPYKSPFLMGNSTINGHFPLLYWPIFRQTQDQLISHGTSHCSSKLRDLFKAPSFKAVFQSDFVVHGFCSSPATNA